MKYLLTLIATLSLLTSSYAQKQNREERNADLLAAKIAYITKEVNLTPQEAQAFWPLYNEYLERKKELSHKKRKIGKHLRVNKTFTSDEKEKLADDFIDVRLKDAIMAKEYHDKFKKILNIDKIIQLYHAESTFKMHLLRKVKDNRHMHRKN